MTMERNNGVNIRCTFYERASSPLLLLLFFF